MTQWKVATSGAGGVALAACMVVGSACVGDSTVNPTDGGDASVTPDNNVPDNVVPSDNDVPDGGPPMYGRFAYVANGADGTITAYVIDGPTGWLRLGSYALGGKAARLAIDAAGKHLYATSGTDTNITMFAIAADGSLPFSGVTKTLPAAPVSVALEPTGHYAYVVGGGGIFQFSIDSAGALTALTPASVPTGAASLAHALAIDPSGKYAYVAANDGLVYQYSLAGNGLLAPLGAASVTGGAGSESIAIDPSSKHVYVTATSDNAVYQYSIGTGGALAALTPPKVSTGGGPMGATVDPTGHYVYVANHDDSTVSQFSINAQTGALGALTPATAATGTNPLGVSMDGSGKYVYTENQTDDTVAQLTVGSSGALTLTRTIRTRDNPTAFAITSGTTPVAYKLLFAYASSYYADDAGADIGQYTIGSSGLLTGVGVAPAAGTAGRFIATNPAGSYLYVSNLLSSSISQYSVGSTGTLTALTPTYGATGTGPIGIVIDPNGRFLYDVDYYANAITAHTITAGKLAITGSALPTGSSPVCASMDPTGRFIYASNSDSAATGSPGPNTSLSSYALDNVTTGLLTAAATYTMTSKEIWCVNVDPTGKYAYAANNDPAAGTIYQYKIDTTGALVALAPASVSTDKGAGIMAFDPFGRFAYTVNGTASAVSQYSIGADGTLAPLSPAKVSTGAGPSSIAVDLTGQHAYVVNATDNTISQFSIGTNGALTQLTPAIVGDYAGSFPTSITTTGVVQ